MSWFKAATFRALRTIAQSALALLGTSTLFSDVEWDVVISGSLMAGLLSVLTSLATGLPEVVSEN